MKLILLEGVSQFIFFLYSFNVEVKAGRTLGMNNTFAAIMPRFVDITMFGRIIRLNQHHKVTVGVTTRPFLCYVNEKCMCFKTDFVFFYSCI